MSSAAYLTIDRKDYDPIPASEWLEFCAQHAIRYSPNTVGQNVFYADDVEITFGEYGTISKSPDGRPDFSTARPPDGAYDVTVSTFYDGNLEGVARMAALIWHRWGRATLDAAPEIQRIFARPWLRGAEGRAGGE